MVVAALAGLSDLVVVIFFICQLVDVILWTAVDGGEVVFGFKAVVGETDTEDAVILRGINEVTPVVCNKVTWVVD